MRKIKIYCKSCNRPLSNIITQVNETSLLCKEGENLVPENSFIYWNTPEVSTPENVKLFTHSETVTLKDHKDTSRFAGCCGAGELDKLNQLCSNCMTEVAIIVSDCWIYHYVAFDISKVFIKDFTDEKRIKKTNCADILRTQS